jgi:hypothetical protein
MQDTISRLLNGVPDVGMRRNLQFIFNALGDRYSSQCLGSAGLVISATTTKVKTGAADTYALANGTLVKIAAGTDQAVLSGTVSNAKFNVFCFYVDSAGVLTSQMGTEGATLAAVVIPTVPVGKAQLGFVVINPTGTGSFIGGTTPLGDATVVPNAAYVNTIGPFDPTVLL